MVILGLTGMMVMHTRFHNHQFFQQTSRLDNWLAFFVTFNFTTASNLNCSSQLKT